MLPGQNQRQPHREQAEENKKEGLVREAGTLCLVEFDLMNHRMVGFIRAPVWVPSSTLASIASSSRRRAHRIRALQTAQALEAHH